MKKNTRHYKNQLGEPIIGIAKVHGIENETRTAQLRLVEKLVLNDHPDLENLDSYELTLTDKIEIREMLDELGILD